MRDFPSLLSSDLTSEVLAYLGLTRKPPSIRYLNQLLRAYIRHVPWESASRIARRHTTPETAECPRWPAEFWTEALSRGTGGTCFENNLALYTLLSTLGFEGYLTINDMLPTRACHTAIILFVQGKKYLVDAAIPLHGVLPVDENRLTKRSTAFHNYTVRPAGANVFEIERSHHPKRNIYTLIDQPVPLAEYQTAVKRDYEPTGFFLDRVILVKVIKDKLWRFNSAERPYKLEAFEKNNRQEELLEEEKLPRRVAEQFGIAEEIVTAALTYIKS